MISKANSKIEVMTNTKVLRISTSEHCKFIPESTSLGLREDCQPSCPNGAMTSKEHA
jgi:hypothetical protein